MKGMDPPVPADRRDANNALFAKVLFQDVMPYVEKHYRVLASPAGRAFGGLSYPNILPDAWFPNIDKFNYVGFTSNGLNADRIAFYEKQYPGVLDDPANVKRVSVYVGDGVNAMTFASAMWATLPFIARHEMGLSALQYGMLIGSFGTGAVAGAGILVVNSEMRIEAFNQKLRELFLRDEREVIGRPCYELLCKRHDPPEECTCQKVLSSRVGAHLKAWEFGDRLFDVAGAPIKNRYGDVTHVVIVYHDITDRVRTEKALRETGEMYRNVFEHASDLIQSVGPDGSFNFVNRAWRDTLGYSEAEVAALSLFDVVHPDTRVFNNKLA